MDPATRIALAVDCGASSGRVIAGLFEPAAGRVEMVEVHRFANGGVWRDGTFAWDWDALLEGICDGIAAGVERFPRAESIAVDTWGLDFGLLDADGALCERPVHYRDERTDRCLGAVDAVMAEADRFRHSGIRQMPINTLNQLVALKAERPKVLARAARLLNVPDLVNHHLTGVARSERTFASTTACALPGAADWNRPLLEAYGLPPAIFGEIIPAGTVLGPLTPAAATRCRLPAATSLTLMTTASHDTAAAVAAVPAAGGGPVCYLSSGTWSLMGTLVEEPLLTDTARAGLLSNEVAWDGRIRLLKNIMGLWISQEVRREWQEAGRGIPFAELDRLTATAPDPALPLDVDDRRFLRPGTAEDPMIGRIAAWYAEQGQPAPTDPGALVRATLAGLAAAYATCLANLEAATGQRFDRIHIIGGGSRDVLLCRLTAAATGRQVTAGPVEATALGNLLVQALGRGWIAPDALPGFIASAAELATYG